jgi:hypothetical protein
MRRSDEHSHTQVPCPAGHPGNAAISAGGLNTLRAVPLRDAIERLVPSSGRWCLDGSRQDNRTESFAPPTACEEVVREFDRQTARARRTLEDAAEMGWPATE